MYAIFTGITLLALLFMPTRKPGISDEIVEAIFERIIKEKYDLTLEKEVNLLEEEVNKFRSSYLNKLVLEINTIRDTVVHLDTATKDLQVKHNDLHGLVGKTASNVNNLELNINTLKKTVAHVDNATQKLQTKHNDLHGLVGKTASHVNNLELNINTLKKTVAHVDNVTQKLQTKHNDLHGLVGKTASNVNNLELNINTLKTTVAHVDNATQELQNKHGELHSLVENEKEVVKDLLSQEQALQERMGHVINNLKDAEHTIKTVQAEAMRTLDEKVSQVKSSTKGLNKSMSELNERVSAISDTSKETAYLFNKLKSDQLNIKHEHNLKMKEFTALKQNMETTKAYLNEKLETTEESFTSLSISLNVMDSRLNQHQNLIAAVEFLQSKYEEKVEPNLFNKGHLLVAFMLLVLLVLITMMSQYRLYQLFRGAGLI